MKAFFSYQRYFKPVHFFILSLSLLFFSCSQPSGKSDVAALNPADNIKPDDNRFTPVTLTAEGALDEPTLMSVSGIRFNADKTH